jgi:hypothetical protein
LLINHRHFIQILGAQRPELVSRLVGAKRQSMNGDAV